MKTSRIQIFIFLFLISKLGISCLGAYQFKIYPVGLVKDTIVTIDFKISRTSTIEGGSRFNLKTTDDDIMEELWIVKSYVSKYSTKQKLFSTVLLDSTFQVGGTYKDSVQKSYLKLLDFVKKGNVQLELFTPVEIKFCNFQKQCKILAVQYDSIADKDYFKYKNKIYPVSFIRDTAFYGFESVYHPLTIQDMLVGGVRVYSSKKMKLIIGHIANATDAFNLELSITDVNSGKNLFLKKGENQLLNYTDLKNTIYTEQMQHHGYGFDAFFVY